MAELDFILQAVTKSNHADSIRTLLKLANPLSVLISVAFARTTGLAAIRESIKPLAPKTKVFVGIRNDITSIQAIKELLVLGVDLHVVDTGSRKIIFHPKLYLASNATKAIGIIGSANMTFNGLHNNIEISTHIDLDLAGCPTDKAFVDSVVGSFDAMLLAHPKHVFKVMDEKHALQLFDEGRLVDEDVVVAPAAGGRVRKGERDDLSPMKLTRATPHHAGKLKSGSKISAPAPKPVAAKPPMVTAKTFSGVKYLVWESKPLSERDLSIPKGTNTNPTGSMGFKKGLYDHIDQRHYFYDEIFQELDWKASSPSSKTLRAIGKFELVIKNINYGVFDLQLSHKTDTESASYKQSNFMTQLHWGDAKPLIAKNDLLERSLCLYRKDTSPPEFMIEID